MSNMNNIQVLPEKSICAYTRCYCEENVWKLCQFINNNHKELMQHTQVIFISNTNKTVPLWCQKAQLKPDVPVIWDYHVILINYDNNLQDYFIYDLDTTLYFPVRLKDYIENSFLPDINLKPEFQQCLKVIDALEFLAHFSSDRSHMRKDDGDWFAKPPEYPCILSDQSAMNLFDFVDMEKSVDWCNWKIYKLSEFLLEYKLN